MKFTLTQKVAFNTIIQLGGKILTTLIAVFTLGILTRYLGSSGYGAYTTIFAFLGLFGILADLGLFSIAVREMAKNPEKAEFIFGNILTIRILAIFLFLPFAILIGFLIPSYSFEIKLGILIGSGVIFFVLLNQVIASIFQVNLRMDRLAISEILGRSVILALIILFVKLKFSLLSIIGANVGGNFVLFLASFLMARKFLKIKFYWDLDFVKKILSETLPLALILVLGLIYFKIDALMLSLIKGIKAVGIYGLPYKILEIIVTFPTIFVGLVFPILSRYIKEDKEKFKRAFQKAFDFLSISSVPIVFGLFMVSEKVIKLIAPGKEFEDSIFVLQILVFAILFIFFGTLLGNTIIAVNLQKKLVFVYILCVTLNIVGNSFLIPSYSYFGAAFTTILTEGLMVFLSFILVFKYLDLFPKISILGKAIISGIAMILVLFIFREINIFLLIFIGAISYGVFLYLTKGISKELIQEFFIKK